MYIYMVSTTSLYASLSVYRRTTSSVFKISILNFLILPKKLCPPISDHYSIFPFKLTDQNQVLVQKTFLSDKLYSRNFTLIIEQGKEMYIDEGIMPLFSCQLLQLFYDSAQFPSAYASDLTCQQQCCTSIELRSYLHTNRGVK